MDCSMPGFPVLHYLLNLLKFMSIGSAMLSNHLVLCHLLLLLPLVFPSIRVFSNESALHIKRPEYWSFSFNIGPSNEYSGLTSFRIDWFDLLTIQGILKSLLQHHSSKASIFRCSAHSSALSHFYGPRPANRVQRAEVLLLLSSQPASSTNLSRLHNLDFL